MDIEVTHRTYFTLVDESGAASPAMEYWAVPPDGAAGMLRKFVKLIGSGETLEALAIGYRAVDSQRFLYRLGR